MMQLKMLPPKQDWNSPNVPHSSPQKKFDKKQGHSKLQVCFTYFKTTNYLHIQEQKIHSSHIGLQWRGNKNVQEWSMISEISLSEFDRSVFST